MKHLTTKFIAALFGWILLGVIALAWTPASAQTITKGYTACGAEATGKDRTQGGKSVTAKLPRQFVGPDGYWHTCQPWIADGGDPTLPEPKPELACPAETNYRAWEVDGVQCTSIPPGESTASTLMLRRTPAGRVGLLMTQPGNWLGTEGMLLMRCVAQPDGTVAWRQDGATCRWVNR